MTREQWQSLQVDGSKWPMPDYMGGEKGHTKFKAETFAQVTLWQANTKIRYRPHAKAPGSKSHLRYESYSRAKTVGEALRLHTYPADWCWDLERGFIKVLGPLREEPFDIVKADASKITDVDTTIYSWYRRELARKLGMTAEQLSSSCAANESVAMRGNRILAQRDARKLLEKCDTQKRKVTDEEITQILQRWPFARNANRVNVLPNGHDWVWSDTFGLLRDRAGDIHRTSITRRYPQVCEIFNRWLVDRLPKEVKDFKFTSINVNCNYAARVHRDNGNFGPSMIKAFGDFAGGELKYWAEDDGTDALSALPAGKKVVFDLDKNLALFNGNSAHAVTPFKGSRYSLVYFTVSCHKAAEPQDKELLSRLGFAYPKANEDPQKLLRAPLGHGTGGKAAIGGSAPPPYRSWSATALATGAASSRKRRRIEPESAKSFYSWQQIAENKRKKQRHCAA